MKIQIHLSTCIWYHIILKFHTNFDLSCFCDISQSTYVSTTFPIFHPHLIVFIFTNCYKLLSSSHFDIQDDIILYFPLNKRDNSMPHGSSLWDDNVESLILCHSKLHLKVHKETLNYFKQLTEWNDGSNYFFYLRIRFISAWSIICDENESGFLTGSFYFYEYKANHGISASLPFRSAVMSVSVMVMYRAHYGIITRNAMTVMIITKFAMVS